MKNLTKKEKISLFSYLSDRFGLSKETFKGLAFFKTESKIYLTTQECIQHPLFLDSETAGIAFIRPNGVLKPTTDFLQLFGSHIKKSVAKLTPEEAERYLRGEDIEKSLDFDNGYVAVKYNQNVLGCANFKQGVIKNQLPKSRRVKFKIK